MSLDLAALTATTTPEDRAAAAKALADAAAKAGDLSKTYSELEAILDTGADKKKADARAGALAGLRCITEALKTKAEPFVAPMLPKIIALMVRRARLPPISDGDHPARLRRSATPRPPAPPPRPADRLPPLPRALRPTRRSPSRSRRRTRRRRSSRACRRTRWSLSCR